MYAASIDALRAFGQACPAAYVTILIRIMRGLAGLLRFPNETIRALER